MASRYIYLGTSLGAYTDELLWLLDDGTDITCLDSINIGAAVTSIAVSPGDGSVFVAYGSSVAKYSYDLVLDGAWAGAGAGVLAIGTAVTEIAVDSLNYLAVAHVRAAGSGNTTTSLYDETGASVWRISVGNVGGTSVEFDAEGNVLAGADAGINLYAHGRRMNRADGALLTSFLLADATPRQVYGVCSSDMTSVYFTRSTSAGATAVVRKYPYVGGAADWSQEGIDCASIYDVKRTADGVYICGSEFGGDTLWKLSNTDGSVLAAIGLSSGSRSNKIDVYPTGEILVASYYGVGADDGKHYILRLLDANLATLRGFYVSLGTAGATAVATGPVTTTAVTKRYLYAAGALTTGVGVYKLVDNGFSMKCTDSLSSGDVGTSIVVSLAATIPYGEYLYVATTDRKIRRFNTDDMTLDTTWAGAGAGVLNISADVSAVYNIAVDASDYMAVACNDASAPKGFVILFDDTGTEVWRYSTADADGGRSVAFLANGDVLAGFAAAAGAKNIVRQLLRATGALVASDETSAGASDRVLATCSEGDVGGHVAWTWSDTTQPSFARYATSALAAAWSASIGSNYLYSVLILGNKVFAGGVLSTDGAPFYTLWQMDKTDGSIDTAYETSATAGHAVTSICTDGLYIYAGGSDGTNTDGARVSVSVFDTSLVYRYGFYAGTAINAVILANSEAVPTVTPFFPGPPAIVDPTATVTLVSIGLFSNGAPTGIDATHVATITVAEGGSTICAKTFNNVTIFPTDGYTELGNDLNHVLSITSGLTVTIDRNNLVHLPEHWIVFIYLRDDNLMCTGCRVVATP
jgi:hypothetical protein